MEVEQQAAVPLASTLHSPPTRQQHQQHQQPPPHLAPHSSSQTITSNDQPSKPISMQTYPPGPSAVCTPPPSSPALGAGPSPRNHYRSETLLMAAAISPTARFYCLGEGKGLVMKDGDQGWANPSTGSDAGAAGSQTQCPQGAVLSVSPTSVIFNAKPSAGVGGGGPQRRQSRGAEGKGQAE